MEQATLDVFSSLFKGRADVWGSVEGRSNKEQVTRQNYERHLLGQVSLGIYPLLDDGYCHFAAIDIDIKDFELAKAVHAELASLSVPGNIAHSKGKGYHVYLFAEDRFLAKEIRQVLFAVLDKCGISAEVFPKQDTLDDVIKFGNYINLPCYGDTRQFVYPDGSELNWEKDLVKVNPESLTRAISNLPPSPPPLVAQTVNTKGHKKTRHPPCIKAILKGVGQGQRDEAAFALARHYLDMLYLPEEALSLLQVWDIRNRPPIGDMRVLQTKVQSAEKGYKFGCSSITDGVLSGYCPGKEQCEWLANLEKEQKKKGLIEDISFYDNGTIMYEEIIQDGTAKFIAYNKETKEINTVDSFEAVGKTLIPVFSKIITEGAVRLPSDVEEYKSTKDLIKAIHDHLLRYIDLDTRDMEFVVWYIIMTWTYDKLPNVQYLRFKGDTGTGKSRCLDAVGDLCYKPMMMSGAITPAPIYRIIEKFRGTLILDEADFSDTSEKSEVVTILNCGYERGRPVLRCSTENVEEVLALPCFGPKIFATRGDFDDKALESRCMTIEMVETSRNDIPPYLGRKYYKQVNSLRNRLLLYRLRVYPTVDPDAGEDIDLGNVEPRLKQTGIPYAISFRDDPEIMDRYKTFIHNRNLDLIQQRGDSAEGRVLYAFLQVAITAGRQYVTAGAIQKYCQEKLKLDLKSGTIGKLLGRLGIRSGGVKRVMGSTARYYAWKDKNMSSLRRRYFPNTDEFSGLFPEELPGFTGESEEE